jgi:hypothetical protein
MFFAGPDRAEVKRAFLAVERRMETPRWNEITWDFYLGLHHEMRAIHEKVAALEPDHAAYVAVHPSKKRFPTSTEARTIYRVLLHIENAVLLVMFDYFNSTHLVPEVLTYDGSQVRPTKSVTDNEVRYHLRQCEGCVLDALGVPITLDTKPMNNVRDLSRYTAGEFIDEWDQFHHIRDLALLCASKIDGERRDVNALLPLPLRACFHILSLVSPHVAKIWFRMPTPRFSAAPP